MLVIVVDVLQGENNNSSKEGSSNRREEKKNNFERTGYIVNPYVMGAKFYVVLAFPDFCFSILFSFVKGSFMNA